MDEDENADDYNTYYVSKNQPGYRLMTVIYNYDGVNTDYTEPTHVSIEHIEDSLELLLHALYCILHAQCEILEKAEGWYEATKIKFWLS